MTSPPGVMDELKNTRQRWKDHASFANKRDFLDNTALCSRPRGYG
jgi:hypothetical protein